jgi:hypothetical protein
MQIKLFKKRNNFKKKDFILNSNLYWRIAISGAFGLILLSFSFGLYLFLQINQESVLPETNGSTQTPMVNKDRISKVLNYFSEREKKSAEILNSPVPIVDPSL